MQLQRYDSVERFCEDAEPFFAQQEAAHNLQLGICSTLRARLTFGNEPPYLALVRDNGRTVAAALRTPPHNLVLSMMEDERPLELILENVAQTFDMLPGVLGPQPLSEAFARRWAALRGLTTRLSMPQRIYQLTTVRHPEGVPGAVRRAEERDRALVRDWFTAFQHDALEGQPVDMERTERSVTNFLTGDPLQRGIYLWEVNGEVVSMAGISGATPNGIRIIAVYTPPELRGRGYASACVAQVSQIQLDAGRRFCFLFTDLNNPTSNHIYQNIGYEPVCDFDEYRFADAEPSADM